MKDIMITRSLLEQLMSQYKSYANYIDSPKNKSDLQLRLTSLKEFLHYNEDTYEDSSLNIVPIIQIIDHYLDIDEKLSADHAKLLNEISERVGFKYEKKNTEIYEPGLSDIGLSDILSSYIDSINSPLSWNSIADEEDPLNSASHIDYEAFIREFPLSSGDVLPSDDAK